MEGKTTTGNQQLTELEQAEANGPVRPPLAFEVDQAQKDAWKAAHGKVYEVADEESVCYLRPVDRLIMRSALSFLKTDRVRYCEIIVENCFLGGDPKWKTDDSKFLALMPYVNLLTEAKEIEVKNL